MNGRLSTIVRKVVTLGLGLGTIASALEVDTQSNEVFDLYYFANGEVGQFGTYDYITANQTTGVVQDSSTYYWNDSLKQAMVNAVNTWTNAIATPYDTDNHARKLRIGFFLDDGSGALMDSDMAGYATYQKVTTNFAPEYGSQANIYSVAEWAWRDNNVTSYYAPPAGMSDYYWEYNLLPSGTNNIDIAIVLNPVSLVFEYDAQGNLISFGRFDRSVEELQNVATHELGHGLGMDSWLYEQVSSGTALSGYVSTWDSLLTLDGQYIVTVENGVIEAKYQTLEELQAAGWEPIPDNEADRTWTEIQYDPDRRLSLDGEVGVHISAIQLEGDTLEHLSYEDGLNVLGPGGTANGTFSQTDLLAMQKLGWDIRPDLLPEPTTTTLSLLALAGLAVRRRRQCD